MNKKYFVRTSGMGRAMTYFKDFVPYLASTTPDVTRELIIGPGIRTTGSFYAGSGSQQISDSTGHIVSSALPPAIEGINGLTIGAGKIMVGNSGGTAWSSVAVSGDASFASSGALTVNKLTPGNYPVQGFISNTLSGNISLSSTSERFQHLKTDSTAARDVTLGSLVAGKEFIIHNIGDIGANADLIIKNASGVEQVRLLPGWYTIAVSKGGGEWKLQTGSRGQPFTVTAKNINSKATGDTTLLIVPANTRFYVTSMSLETTAVTGSTTAGPVFGLGTSGNQSNIVALAKLANSYAVDTYQTFDPKVNATVLPGGSSLLFRVVTASGATTHTNAVRVTGYYE